MTVYRTYALAERRVFALARAIGVWPGIISCYGGYRLTYDPGGTLFELDAHGYVKNP